MKKRVAWNKGLKVGLTEYNRKKRTPDAEVFCQDSSFSQHRLKKRIIDGNMLPYECTICGIDDQWNGKTMPLILDHINGINNDHRLENLRFVCSNCDSQLSTYKSRNINKKSK